MLWMLLLIGLLAVFGYVLWMPLELKLNTYSKQYFFRFGGIGKIGIEEDPDEIIRFHLSLLGMHFFWRPSDFKPKQRPKQKSSEKAMAKKQGFPLKKGIALLKSFRLEFLYWELDTGDFSLNARLYPLFFLLSSQKRQCSINFNGTNQLALQLTNRPIYILNAFINP